MTPGVWPVHSDRGQVEPLAALAALFAVCVGITTYAAVLADTGHVGDRDRAGPALAAVEDAVTVRGVVHPDRLERARDRGPSGMQLNVTVATERRRWTHGPPPGQQADRAVTAVSVRLGPGRLRTGRLRVAVWR